MGQFHLVPTTFLKALGLVLLTVVSTSTMASWTSFEFQGSRILFYRPILSGAQKKPLMINLHGCAQKGKVLKDHGNWEQAANKHKAYIAIPEVPEGGVYAGCWDYYGLSHQRGKRHNHFILALVDHIKGLYKINPHQVYLSGLSSGAGLAFTQACLAPEVFAGIGLNAGPSVGTSASEITRAQISVKEIKNNCLKLAANKRSHLQTQVASVIFGDNDFIVDPDYNRKNAKALSELYGSDSEEGIDLSKLHGSHLEGKGTLYKKGEQALVSVIENTGLGHNWPAGSGGKGASFVSSKSINYPSYLLNFLISNNRRP